MNGLVTIDELAVLAIFAKAIGYASAMIAIGGVLFATFFASRADAYILRLAQQLAVGAATIGLAILALRFSIRAARISGMGFEGAISPMMLGFIWDSPLGTAAIWRALGYIGIIAIWVPLIGRWLALAGALSVAISYTQVGHTLGEHRAELAAFLVLHILAVAFWIGALAPLRRAVLLPKGAELLHYFGKVALFGVGVLIVAGAVIAYLLTGSIENLFGTTYGVVLVIKIGLVSCLLCLALLNKSWLVPALLKGKQDAPKSLRRSILLEMLIVALILLLTATMTSVMIPPNRL